MTLRLSPAELHTLQGQPPRQIGPKSRSDARHEQKTGSPVSDCPRQLNLFKSRRQRGSLPPPAPEFNIQCMVADDLRRFAHPEWQLTHIPNGGLRNKITAYQLKRAGTKPGWPDMLLLDPFGRPHFLELKRKTGRMSEAQEAFASWRNARQLVAHAVAYSYQEARRILITWGALRGIA